jgi:hypothetical protein
VEETVVPGENHRPVVSHCQTLSHNVVLCLFKTPIYWKLDAIRESYFFIFLFNYQIIKNSLAYILRVFIYLKKTVLFLNVHGTAQWLDVEIDSLFLSYKLVLYNVSQFSSICSLTYITMKITRKYLYKNIIFLIYSKKNKKKTEKKLITTFCCQFI